MNDIINATMNLEKIAQQFAFIANGQIDYIKYGNAFVVPEEWEL